MRNFILIPLLLVSFCIGSASAGIKSACTPEFQAVAEHARVVLRGTGDYDITILSDPFCWHCRLGHKLLSEYPEKYGKLGIVFYPRSQFIGSDMACWILEDGVSSGHLEAMVDYAYTDLKQPKTKNLMEARMLVLIQFAQRFPHLTADAPLEEVFVRMQQDHEARVLKGAELAEATGALGTPVLLAGKTALVGYGAGAWLKALDEQTVCE